MFLRTEERAEARLNTPEPSHIVPAMKKIALTMVLAAAIALPAAAQSSEVGFLYGGSARAEVDREVISGGDLDDSFSFDNNSLDFYWATDFDEDTRFKLKVGRIESIVSSPVEITDDDDETVTVRADAVGDIEHASGLVEYRFSEFFGTTGLFAGVGLYRAQADGETETDYGFQAGVTGDFPLNRRYGVIVEGAYHWTNLEFRPKYITVGAGLRVRF
jgi:hypothetical protein